MKKDFSNIILNFLKILFLIVLCLVLAFLIVWPLWKFSTTFSKAYSIIILSFILAGIIYLVVLKIRKTPVLKTFQFLSNFILILAGITFSVIFLLNYKRIFSLLVLLLLLVLELLVNYLFTKKNNE